VPVFIPPQPSNAPTPPQAPIPPQAPAFKAPPPPKPPAAPVVNVNAAPVNVRSNLLQQIQQGKVLKTRQEEEEKKPSSSAPVAETKADLFNVDKILARRNAIADSDDEEDDDYEEWD